MCNVAVWYLYFLLLYFQVSAFKKKEILILMLNLWRKFWFFLTLYNQHFEFNAEIMTKIFFITKILINFDLKTQILIDFDILQPKFWLKLSLTSKFWQILSLMQTFWHILTLNNRNFEFNAEIMTEIVLIIKILTNFDLVQPKLWPYS